MSLLSRLFLLVAIALLPAVVIQAYNEVDLRHSRQKEIRANALQLAESINTEQLGIRPCGCLFRSRFARKRLLDFCLAAHWRLGPGRKHLVGVSRSKRS